MFLLVSVFKINLISKTHGSEQSRVVPDFLLVNECSAMLLEQLNMLCGQQTMTEPP